MDAEAPLKVVGRYAIFGEIASGGMATVHLGRLLGPVGFSRTVAIKRLHEQFAKDPEFVTMFIDEARLAARIRHPNVVQTIDVVQSDGQLLLVMEYVHGLPLSSLSRLARTRGRMPPRIASAIVSGTLRGLHAAHEATDEAGKPLELVHRDVSPHNILVGTDGVPRVLDFGVAKATGRLQQTAQGQLKGKVPYMAPEQVKGFAVNRRTDVYAAGVVLWETLVGRRLFQADNEAAVISMILAHQIEPPSRIDLAVPKEIDAVVMRALHPDAAARFPDAREMARAVEAAIPPASAAEIGEWVESIGGDQLGKRSAQVASVESTSAIKALPPEIADQVLGASTESAPASGSSRNALGVASSQVSSVSVVQAPEAAPARRFGVIAALAVVIAALAVAVVVLATNKERPTVGSSGEPSGSASMPPPATTASATTAPTVASASAAASTTAAPTSSHPKAAQTAATKKASTPPVAKDDCDPPYTYDAKGTKHYKEKCL